MTRKVNMGLGLNAKSRAPNLHFPKGPNGLILYIHGANKNGVIFGLYYVPRSAIIHLKTIFSCSFEMANMKFV